MRAEQVAEIKGRYNRREAIDQIARSMGLATGYVIAALTGRYAHIPASDLGLLPQPNVEFADPDLMLLKQSVCGLNEAMKRLSLF